MSFWTRITNYKLFIFLVCLFVISAQFIKQGYHQPYADEFGYIGISDDLNRLGTFTNGPFSEAGKAEKAGAFFAPAYPMFLSFASQITPEAQNTLHCYAQKLKTCEIQKLLPVFVLQIILAAISATLIYFTVFLLFENKPIAWLALILVLIDKTHVEYARHLLTENLAFFFFYLFGFLLVFATHKGTYLSWAMAGGALALAALARPSYYYLIFFMPLIVILWELKGRNSSLSFGVKAGAIFFACAFIVLLPWMLRNYMALDQFVLSNGYASFILVQRIAYNAMSWAEWAVSFIYWLPDFGDSLAADLFPEELYQKLSWYDPEAYYRMGSPLRATTLALAGGKEFHFDYLINEYLIADLFKHIMVTFSIALRGMWTGKYIGFVGFIGLIPVFFMLAKQGLAGRFLIYLIPGYFILGLNAFVSVNVVRYNEPLIVVFSTSCAILLVLMGQKIAESIKGKFA